MDLLQKVPCGRNLSTKFFVNFQSPEISRLRVIHMQVLLIKQEEGWLQHKESEDLHLRIQELNVSSVRPGPGLDLRVAFTSNIL
jgi:hypothetical protein